MFFIISNNPSDLAGNNYYRKLLRRFIIALATAYGSKSIDLLKIQRYSKYMIYHSEEIEHKLRDVEHRLREAKHDLEILEDDHGIRIKKLYQLEKDIKESATTLAELIEKDRIQTQRLQRKEKRTSNIMDQMRQKQIDEYTHMFPGISVHKHIQPQEEETLNKGEEVQYAGKIRTIESVFQGQRRHLADLETHLKKDTYNIERLRFDVAKWQREVENLKIDHRRALTDERREKDRKRREASGKTPSQKSSGSWF